MSTEAALQPLFLNDRKGAHQILLLCRSHNGNFNRSVGAFIVALMIALSHSCPAQTCETQKERYANLTNRLLVGWNSDNEKKILAERNALTAEASELIRASILGKLTGSGHTTSSEIVGLVRCLQNQPAYQGWESLIGLPKAFLFDTPSRDLAVGYFIYRGPVPAGIPDTLPFIDFFKKGSNGWEYAGSAGADFRASTFEIHAISSGVPDESWFLLSGFQIGDTGTRLRLQLISFDGHTVKVTWQHPGLVRTTLKEVGTNYLVLSEYKGFSGTHDVFKDTRWNIVATGLKPDGNQ